MGEGLRNAALEALCSRGPWTSSVAGLAVELTSDEIRALYAHIAAGKPDPELVIGCRMASDRKFDRAIQLLRRAGLVRYVREGRRWVAAGVPDAD